MGAAMAGHLLDAGYDLSVFTRTPEKADKLVSAGAKWCNTPGELAQQSDVVFSIVGHPSDVQEVVLGTDGVLSGLASGGIVVDMTTSSPKLAEEIYAAASSQGCSALDAPVSGGDVGAINAALTIMCGGDEEAFEQVRPMMSVMGSSVQLLGPAGSGQRCKAVNQTVIASSMIAMAEGLVLAHRAGLDPMQVVETIQGGAAGSFSLSKLGPRVLRGDTAPGFTVDHFVKDLGIALSLAEELGLRLRGVELAKELYEAMQKRGRGGWGTQALVLAVEEAATTEETSVVGLYRE